MENKGRPVRVSIDGGDEMQAIFHEYSTMFAALPSGTGQFPIAIVEFPNGMIAQAKLSEVRFVGSYDR